jgi:NAD(P)H-hydrate epimerase
MPPRITNGSKYDHGIAILIAGSKGMTGAASLASLAAYRAGLGLLHLISDEESLKIISSNILEIVSHSLGEDDLELCKSLLKKHVSVFSLGPGLSSSHNDLVQNLVTNINAPMILDADAINAWEHDIKKLKKHKHDLLITPHAGEYARLFGKLAGDIKPLDLIKELRAKAQDYSMTILYKGAPTIILDPNGKAFIVPYGNSGLATAGSGDVLTGLITGFSAQIYTIKSKYPEIRFFYEDFNISPLTQAAILAAYLHGKCAELAAKELTEYSVMASDLIRFIPRAIKQIN